MNLLLYAESRVILARQNGEPIPAGAPQVYFLDQAPLLPDALFEELGYYGALDEESDPAGADGDEALGELFHWFVTPALNY